MRFARKPSAGSSAKNILTPPSKVTAPASKLVAIPRSNVKSPPSNADALSQPVTKVVSPLSSPAGGFREKSDHRGKKDQTQRHAIPRTNAKISSSNADALSEPITNVVSPLSFPSRGFRENSDDGEKKDPIQRHTFAVSKNEVSCGDHAVAVQWLLREIPHASRLEIRYFTADDRAMSLEFTWVSDSDGGVSRGIDISVTEHQAVPLGVALLYMVAEVAKNVKELKLYSGLERIDDLRLGKMLTAFSVAGHWHSTLEKLEITCSCIESDTFSRLQTYPSNVKTIVLDGCMVMDENEVNIFLANVPKLESFQVVGNSQRDQRSYSMFSI